MRRFKIKLLNQKHILPGIFVILSFCMAEKPGRKEPAAQIQEPDQKKVALAILQAKCNTCHSVQNPRKVFTLENMSGLAPKIYQQVFVKNACPGALKTDSPVMNMIHSNNGYSPKKSLTMELSIKSISLFTAVLLTGLSAGLFYAWSVSIIPGARKVTDLTYMESMQSFNRAILNPAFFLVFMGSGILLSISAIQHYRTGIVFWVILAAALCYVVGTFGVTMLGNVPLNNSLDVFQVKDMSAGQIAAFREHFEEKWNRLHTIRTAFSILSFMFSIAAIFLQAKNIKSL
jgi:uncharacterized membrane protein